MGRAVRTHCAAPKLDVSRIPSAPSIYADVELLQVGAVVVIPGIALSATLSQGQRNQVARFPAVGRAVV